MPFGNGGPRGLANPPVTVLTDPRAYNTASTTGPNVVGFTPLAKSTSSVYSQVIAATPGLAHWWRMGALVSDTVGNVIKAAAGSAQLTPVGTVSIVPGLIAGSTDGAALLSGAYLHANDYFLHVGAHEVFTLECWVKFVAIPASDSALFGQWGASNGWMLLIGSADAGATGRVALHLTNSNFTTGAILTAGKTYHIVGTSGGTDYKSVIYVNGVSIVTGNLAASTVAASFASTIQFEVGQYANHAGTNNLNAVIDEVAIYSRMLQPAEVMQHYKAAFTRSVEA